MAFKLNWEAHGVVKDFSGAVTVEEIQVATLQVEASDRFDTCRYVINDFSACVSITVNHAIIKQVAAVDGAAMRTNPNIKIAVVTTMPEVIEMAEAYANSPHHSYPTRLFSTMEAARLWVMGDRKEA